MIRLEQDLKILRDEIIKNANENSDETLFEKLAKYLLEHCILVNANNERFKLATIEFYLYKEKYHEDSSVHKNEQQKLFGHWYLHKRNNVLTTAYTRMGIDLCLGDDKAGVYFGVLLRQITSLDGSQRTVGPAKTLHLLLPSVIRIDQGKKITDTEKYTTYDNQFKRETVFQNDALHLEYVESLPHINWAERENLPSKDKYTQKRYRAYL